MRNLAASALLAFQVLSIAWRRTVPEKYFCWAPYDRQTRYRIEASLDGRPLSQDEIKRRYRWRAQGWDQRAEGNVIGAIDQYERTYGRTRPASVTIRYSVNGGPEQVWKRP